MSLPPGAGGYLLRRAAPEREREQPCAVSGEVPDICFLVATSGRGLLLYRRGRLMRLLRGSCYGLTCHDGWWYAFQQLGSYGRIARFRLEGGRPSRLSTVLTGLNYGIHQIDFIDGALVLVDTLKDRLLVYEDAPRLRQVSWRRWSQQVYPAGVRTVRDYRWDRLRGGRDAKACWHFNSVFATGGTVYLVAHNRSVLSGRRSQLFVLDGEFRVREVRELGAADVHNFWTDGVREMFCASARGALRGAAGAGAGLVAGAGPSAGVALGGYLRGLSVGGDFVLVGSSRLAAGRQAREAGDGLVHVLDAGLAAVGQVRMPGTQVYEIRRVDAADLALSAAPAAPVGQAAEPPGQIAGA